MQSKSLGRNTTETTNLPRFVTPAPASVSMVPRFDMCSAFIVRVVLLVLSFWWDGGRWVCQLVRWLGRRFRGLGPITHIRGMGLSWEFSGGDGIGGERGSGLGVGREELGI